MLPCQEGGRSDIYRGPFGLKVGCMSTQSDIALLLPEESGRGWYLPVVLGYLGILHILALWVLCPFGYRALGRIRHLAVLEKRGGGSVSPLREGPASAKKSGYGESTPLRSRVRERAASTK